MVRLGVLCVALARGRCVVRLGVLCVALARSRCVVWLGVLCVALARSRCVVCAIFMADPSSTNKHTSQFHHKLCRSSTDDRSAAHVPE